METITNIASNIMIFLSISVLSITIPAMVIGVIYWIKEGMK